MKKQVLLVAVVMFLAVGQMFAQGQNRIGGHLAYGTKDLNLGFGANAEFSLSDNLSIAPKFTYFLGKSEGSGLAEVSFSAWSLDGDVHYYFTTEGTSFYGLAGLTYASISTKSSFFGQSISASDSKIGLNLGVGANFNTGSSFVPFGEVKYSTPFEALVISAGVRFPLGGK
ncbi:MAG: outer membrane protein [Cyclobacteriaceae bacterium]|jgi:outer membrane immunogenic protein|nr:outer membrane beta-barrel protein [Flammeovirgaceae bacterium]